MRKIITLVSAMALPFVLSACATPSYPYAINGRYYMVGDKACQSYKPLNATLIRCIDSNGQEAGYRVAMTNDDLVNYGIQQQQLAASRAAVDQQIEQGNAAIADLNRSLQQQNQSWQAPQANTPSPPGSSYTYCRRMTDNIVRCW